MRRIQQCLAGLQDFKIMQIKPVLPTHCLKRDLRYNKFVNDPPSVESLDIIGSNPIFPRVPHVKQIHSVAKTFSSG